MSPDSLVKYAIESSTPKVINTLSCVMSLGIHVCRQSNPKVLYLSELSLFIRHQGRRKVMYTKDAIFSRTLKILLFFLTLFSSALSSRSRSRCCDAHAGAAASYSNHSLMHCCCALFKLMIQWLTQMFAHVPLRPESRQDLPY